MTKTELSAKLATGWIEAWIRMDIEWLKDHLTTDFVHTSPFGRLAGREHYLETVEPMARKSVQRLKIEEVVATNDQAAIWFENLTPQGAIPSCDWVRVERGKIKEIQSFYDSMKVRQVLSNNEQSNLGDT
ncbi:nuclear transport factor 2 family protein [Pseudoalteromonas sp. CO325X]|uniref:nuclear transport factor 2 family protein n=1 Tax=Pseudoalteromonas sp. CO325X TaxID=1777262 RepID=UPI001023470A|nr:nuclear transport factor 2 family protein [Pseudoalteromonas sp. CO325X]RZF79952.1 nuclear transport factor 2 family protein [Pseudoalteromonas sp. CO325X]